MSLNAAPGSTGSLPDDAEGRPSRPFLILIAPIVLLLLGLQAVFWGLVAGTDGGSGGILTGQGILGPDGTRRAMGLFYTIAGGLILAAGWGFLVERSWARSLLVGLLALSTTIAIVAGAAMAGVGGMLGVALIPGILTALVWSYLYDGRAATTYYAWLEARETEKETGAG